MPSTVAPTPGMRVLCRDAEWLVTRVDPSDNAHKHYAVHCIWLTQQNQDRYW